jgi:hypothetical protein
VVDEPSVVGVVEEGPASAVVEDPVSPGFEEPAPGVSLAACLLAAPQPAARVQERASAVTPTAACRRRTNDAIAVIVAQTAP